MATIGIRVDTNFQEASNDLKKFAGITQQETARINKQLKRIESFNADSFIQKNKRIALSVQATKGRTAGLITEHRGLERQIQMLIRNGIDPMDDRLKSLRAEYNRTGAAMKRSQKNAINWSSGLTTAAIAATAAFFAINKLLSVTSNLAEQTTKFNKVFEGVTLNMAGAVDILRLKYALSTRAARQFLASTQDLLKPLGIAPNLAAKLSNEVVKLSADIGSFNNMPTADVMRAIQSALVGSFRPMKQFGVVINQTNLAQEAFALGLAKTKKEMTPAIKAQAAMSLIMKGSKDATGDMIRTGASYANQVKFMKARMEDMTGQLGQAFLPTATEVIAAVSSMATWFTELDKDTQQTIITIAAVATAIIVLTKIVMAFGVGFKIAFAKVIAFMVLALAVIDAIKGTGISIDALKKKNQELAIGYVDLNKKTDMLKKSIDLTKELNRTREGTKKHIEIVKKLKILHPKLATENKKTGGSFTNLARNIENANVAQKRLIQTFAKAQLRNQMEAIGKAIDKAFGDSKKMAEVGKQTKLFLQTAKAAGMSEAAAMNMLLTQTTASLGLYRVSIFNLAREGIINLKSFGKAFRENAKTVFNAVEKKIVPAAKKFKKHINNAVTPSGKGITAFQKLLNEYKRMMNSLVSEAQVNAEITRINTENRFTAETEMLISHLGAKQTLQVLAMAERLRLAGEEGKALELISAATNKAVEKNQKFSSDKMLSGTANFFGALAGVVQKGGAKSFGAYKALAIAQATVAGVQAAINAFNAGMMVGGPLAPFFAAAFAAASIVKTGSMINQITKQKPPSAETGGNFIVPDNPSSTRVDSQTMRVNPGENVNVTPRGEDGPGSMTVNVLIDRRTLFTTIQEGFNNGEMTITNANIVSV